MNKQDHSSENLVQESILISIHAQLNCQTDFNKAIKYILGRSIRSYYEFTGNEELTWKKIELYKKHHKFTKRAADLLRSGATEKQLHYEHMVPVSLLLQQLFALDDKSDINEIRAILDTSEVVILSKEEATVLDGNKQLKYLLDGNFVNGKGLRTKGTMEERLKAIGAELDPEFKNNKL
ncbi:MAG: hypothetical protein AB7E51_17570 [Pseudodesulfovibrio sp.]|uniref:hypothetical protein n=1 Tax=Pseudodesulfovibrio sp. TaxID=2035812 RepID=UPI003D0E3AD6